MQPPWVTNRNHFCHSKVRTNRYRRTFASRCPKSTSHRVAHHFQRNNIDTLVIILVACQRISTEMPLTPFTRGTTEKHPKRISYHWRKKMKDSARPLFSACGRLL